jgi:hypothetical protein
VTSGKILIAPIAVQEATLGAWLIIRGFTAHNPDLSRDARP